MVYAKAVVAVGVIALVGAAATACSSSSGTTGPSRDGGADGAAEGSTRPHDSGLDTSVAVDGTLDAEMASDAPVATTALVRLANWSPDAPGLDFCVAAHGTSMWTGPILAGALGKVAVGNVTVTDAGLPMDSGSPPLIDAGVDAGAAAASDARVDAPTDASLDALLLDASRDGGAEAGAPDAGVEAATAPEAGRPLTGVLFPRVSPYESLTPGLYDLRVVAAGSSDCTAPVLPEIDDLAALKAGDIVTFAAVGDTVDQGADPALALSVLNDDSTVGASNVALRFINAVPSVTGVTFASGLVATANAVPFLASAQFGNAGVDTDAGALDSNDYLVRAPLTSEVWSLINANGGTSTLTAVIGESVPSGRLVTAVAVGGESGPNEAAIGILVCVDVPPIAAGESATCNLLEASGGVCPSCP
jgi:hypothetical protein